MDSEMADDICENASRPPARLSLPPRLGPSYAGDLVGTLRDMRGQPLEIDPSGVQSLSTPCLQILLSAARSWAADGQPLRLTEPSPEFMATLGYLGVEPGSLQSEPA
jgi:chemotaxis protein CheX